MQDGSGEQPTLADILRVLRMQACAMTRQTEAVDSFNTQMGQRLDAQGKQINEGLGRALRERQRVEKDTKEYTDNQLERVKSEVKEEMGQLAIDLKTHISKTLGRGVGGYQSMGEAATGLVKEEPCSASEWVSSDSGGEQVLGAQSYGVLRQGPSARATPRSAAPTPPSTPSPPSSPSHKAQGSRRRCRRGEGARKRPQEFDGTVSWEAYRAQFELLAKAWGWSRYERAVQLVGALKGSALEVLNQLPAGKQTSYSSVLAVLERRYGHQHQSEVFRARFRARLRNPGESLPHLAQDLEQLVRRAYPGASEDMITLLLRDQFVDAVNHPQIKIYIQQAHVEDLQQALARGLEMESFLRTSQEVEGPTHRPRTMFRARKGHVQSPQLALYRPQEFSPATVSAVGRKVTGRRNALGRGAKASHLEGVTAAGTSTSRAAGIVGRLTALASAHKTGTLPAGRPQETLSGWERGPNPSQSTRGPTPSKVPLYGRQDRAATKQQLCGVTGHCTKLRGPVQARIEVGEAKEELPVYVADLDENLLGLDFLQQSKAVLDLGSMTMRAKGGEVTLQGRGQGHYSWEDGTGTDVLTPEPCGSEDDEERVFWPEEEDAGDMGLVPLTSLEPSEQAAAEEPTSIPVDVGGSEVQATGLGGARPKRPRRYSLLSVECIGDALEALHEEQSLWGLKGLLA
ncbi:hypothetical protein GWK47_011790 [Chionoecetes opilio]|uniref:Paraneoplastic antigen Ma-like C-terminal domain-containing protein n=1 Tax=Chionoecetes opilio TaxID=41210 RepID=A0A8J5CM61_CHIOP|nr:hypothetical protein GWK47_011790 [Chionoecetes opilio]